MISYSQKQIIQIYPTPEQFKGQGEIQKSNQGFQVHYTLNTQSFVQAVTPYLQD